MAATSTVEVPIVDQAYVTLVTNDNYAPGAAVLGHSLRRVGTSRHIVCMISNAISPHTRSMLEDVFDVLFEVDTIDSNDKPALALLARPELGVTFTKLNAWRLTSYKKCVFMDADTLVIQNIDDLFEREELSAAPDVGWPDCFNSGVFVYAPSMETFEALVQASKEGSFDGGDQGLLNDFFNTWSTGDAAHRLPFVYNMTANASYGYAPAYRRFQDGIKVIHYIGAQKPWHGMPTPSASNISIMELYQRWWNAHRDFSECCSESADYKVIMGIKPSRRSGVEADFFVRAPESPAAQVHSPSHHDQPKPRFDPSTSYLSSHPADDITRRISELAATHSSEEGDADADDRRLSVPDDTV